MSVSSAFRLLALFVLFLSIASAASAKTKSQQKTTTKPTSLPKTTSAPKNNSAKCPDFKKGSCSKSECDLPSSSHFFKFRVNILNALDTSCPKCAVNHFWNVLHTPQDEIKSIRLFLFSNIPIPLHPVCCRLSCA